jgi:hypothetical protein
MGKLILILLALIIVLVILPGDIRNWCMVQLETLMADLTETAHTDLAMATAEVASDLMLT